MSATKNQLWVLFIFLCFIIMAGICLREHPRVIRDQKILSNPGSAYLIQNYAFNGKIQIPENSPVWLQSLGKELQNELKKRLDSKSSIPLQTKPIRKGIQLQINSQDPCQISHNRGKILVTAVDEGTMKTAVFYLLQRYFGYRWYWDGPLGEVISNHPDQWIPRFSEKCQPSFLSRWLWGVPQGWADRNLLDPRFDFHHGLYRIFTDQVYEENPDFRPSYNGKPVMRSAKQIQPDLGNPAVMDFTAKKVAEYFDKNPHKMSYRLGINDNATYGNSVFTEPLIRNHGYFRDVPDYSNLVFHFMNGVAKRLETTHPDKYIGCLAYSWAENVPDFPVHPKVIPYLTADRMQGYDPVWKAEDQELTLKWRKAGTEHIGHYDYFYGGPYTFPRISFTLLSESISFAHQSGVSGFVSEVSPLWPIDAPKLWLISQLLWNIEQDPQTLLKEYFNDLFGGAATAIEQFYQIAEKQWHSQTTEGLWIRLYTDENGVSLYPLEVIESMRSCLEKARKINTDPLVEKRIDLISQCFSMTESSHAARTYHNQLVAQPYQSVSDIREAIEALQKWKIHYAEFRGKLDSLTKNTHYTKKASGILTQHLRWKPSAPEKHALCEVNAYLKSNPNPGLEKEIQLVIDKFPAIAKTYEILRNNRNRKIFNRSANGGFENHTKPPSRRQKAATIEEPPSWRIRMYRNESFFYHWIPEAAYQGERGIRIEGNCTGYLRQLHRLKKEHACQAEFWYRGKILPGSTIQIRFLFHDAERSFLETQQVSLPQGEWEWKRHAIIAIPPEETEFVSLEINFNRQDKNGWLEIDNAHLMYLPIDGVTNLGK